jgi:hypothetical protein
VESHTQNAFLFTPLELRYSISVDVPYTAPCFLFQIEAFNPILLSQQKGHHVKIEKSSNLSLSFLGTRIVLDESFDSEVVYVAVCVYRICVYLWLCMCVSDLLHTQQPVLSSEYWMFLCFVNVCVADCETNATEWHERSTSSNNK